MAIPLNNPKKQPDKKNPQGAEWEHLLNLLKILVILFIIFSSFHLIIIKRVQHLPAGNSLPHSSITQTPTTTKTKIYSVKEGDTLWKIAFKQYPNRNPEEMIKEIKKINQMTSDSIKAGQPLRLP